MTLPVNEASVIFGEIVEIRPNTGWKGNYVVVKARFPFGKEDTTDRFAEIEFDDYHDKTIAGLSAGDKVQVSYIMGCRKAWADKKTGEDKYFTKLSGKSIKRMEAQKTNKVETPTGLNFAKPTDKIPF